MIKIIFLDFDGTLYSHSIKAIPQSAIDALNKAHDNGIKSFLSSGRDKYEMSYFDLSKLYLDGMISLNGQVSYDNLFNIIDDNPMSGELKNQIVSKFNKKVTPIILCSEKGFYINFVDDFVRKVQEKISSPVPSVGTYNDEKIYMASCFYENIEMQKELMSLENVATITYWQDGGVDIISKGSSKATAISNILKLYNIKQEETMAFGDGHNDISMIKYCNIGVAMGNGHEELKKAADYVSTALEDDGIALALKHFNII